MHLSHLPVKDDQCLSMRLTQATASGQAPIVWDRVIKEGKYVLFLPLGDYKALYHDKPFVVGRVLEADDKQIKVEYLQFK